MRIQTILDSVAPTLTELSTKSTRADLPMMPLSAAVLQAWSFAVRLNRPVVFITDGPQTLDLAHRDLVSLSPFAKVPVRLPCYFPGWEVLATGEQDLDITGHRLRALLHLTSILGQKNSTPVVVTSIQAVMQAVPPRALLEKAVYTVDTKTSVEPDVLAEALQKQGYAFGCEVLTKGQAALRGGILDAWPCTALWPVRIEFFGDQITSIRAFDPADQRSIERTNRAVLTPVDERSLCDTSSSPQTMLLDYLTANSVIIAYDHTALQSHALAFEDAVSSTPMAPYTLPFARVTERFENGPDCFMLSLNQEASHCPAALDFRPVQGSFDLPRGLLEPDLRARTRQTLLLALKDRVKAGDTVCIYCETEGSRDHLKASFPQSDNHHVQICSGGLSGGFVSTALRLIVLSEGDLYGRKALGQRYDPVPSTETSDRAGPRITTLSDIEPGDLVVHIDHGLGRYRGLYDIVMSGKEQEVISIEYADSVLLHLPVSHAHLLSRYIGTSKRTPPLHRLGSKRWTREKAEAAVAVEDLAASLLETQAHRDMLEGHAFPSDTPWQHEFASSFPHTETTDQVRVINEVKHDMESNRPMDRLICGDAGYGKTEVAMRAAFKAVMGQKQVAVLVPTTVLAQQHYQTFCDRMAPYPIHVDMLSRFRTQAARSRVLRGMADGTVDIVIGTHALVQPGVRFKDLGLVIIDEEQRFGVKHKERFKELRRLVDVLTMTATPIPRTLYMSMTGARDMSLLQTPPRERMAIETVATRDTDDTIRKAILQEINREGQVYYLHNRVLSIDRIRERLERIVPEARIEVAHGQMAAAELADIMRRFIAGDFDVLLCTTIIESGVDIPRANTILIDRADRFGIADLYQLRGRVGRSSHKAYAYFLLPATGRIEPDARERIAAIKKYSSLSAGFNLALRDLEIRGAGNMLGTAQSGHIAAVGFALYCQLLKRSVARLSGKPIPHVIDVMLNLDFIDTSSLNADSPAAAMIPYAYIEQEPLRVDCYRRIAEATTDTEIEAVATDLCDRFGPPPPAVTRLLTLARLRLQAAKKGLHRLETRDGKVMIGGPQDLHMPNGRFPRLQATEPDQRIGELSDIIAGIPA